MKKSSSTKEKPEAPEYVCHLCNVTCMSALNLQTHFLGIKHRKVEVALRNFNAEKEEKITLEPDATLQEHVDACKDSEPAVGLEYIYQYQQNKNFLFECRLCECHAGLTHMFMHIIGAKHRLTYMFKHHPKLSRGFAPYVPSGPKKLKKLRDLCLTVEKEFGRQKINIIDALETQWHFSTGASTVNYDPDNELNQMDFTSDDFFGTNKPKEHIITFLELKAAHEADKRAASSSDNIASSTEESKEVIPIPDTEQEIQKDADEESTKETCEKEVSSEEPSETTETNEDFTSNKDLLDFLEDFRILETGDAEFVNKVVEMLSTALVQHKKISTEKMLCVSTCDDPEEQDEPQTKELAPSVVPSKQEPKTQSKKPLFPIPQPIPIDPLSQRRKLAFTLSSNKAQELVIQCSNDSTTKFDPTKNIFQTAGPEPKVKKVAPCVDTSGAPSGTQLPPKVAQPLFPVEKGDVVQTFFNSIKNMEVSEVAKTLTKITATNPAFKGIHVPSLVRYLTETGKLKSAESMQQQNQ